MEDKQRPLINRGTFQAYRSVERGDENGRRFLGRKEVVFLFRAGSRLLWVARVAVDCPPWFMGHGRIVTTWKKGLARVVCGGDVSAASDVGIFATCYRA